MFAAEARVCLACNDFFEECLLYGLRILRELVECIKPAADGPRKKPAERVDKSDAEHDNLAGQAASGFTPPIETLE